MYKETFVKIVFGMVLIFMTIGQAVISFAQFDLDESYEVSVEVPVLQNDFVKARKKAVSIALRSALEQDLREILGEDDFEQNRKEIQKMLKTSNKYVKSYRFLEAYDDSVELTSRIKVEVVFFQEAISRALNTRGVAVGFEAVKQVVILINESSLSTPEDPNFWEFVPIFEMLLTRSFIEAGIPVVRRNSLHYEISKKVVIAAIDGDISAAVNIGSKVGADIVIVGNATSASVVDKVSLGGQKVRVGINVKVVSSSQSAVVAAKSDFASASENEAFASEREAFHRAGKKITEFLIPAIEEYWAPSSKKRAVQRSITKLPKTDNSLPFGDL